MNSTRSITEFIVQEGYAQNGFAAGYMYEGLKLKSCKSFEEQVERVKLYRAWRAKTDVKNDIPAKQAYDLAIAGIDPKDVQIRQMELGAVQKIGELLGVKEFCPSCTWRMDIELENGVCPQCGVNWHELQQS